MAYLSYGEEAVQHLKQGDPQMAQLISRYGFIKRAVYDDLFDGLIHTIISQLISLQAAKTIYTRLLSLCGTITPKIILTFDMEEIKAVGLTKRKAESIYQIATEIEASRLDLEGLRQRSDDEVMKELCKLKGIGEWSAEMFLLHGLQRLNVISYKDLMIRNGICKLYGLLSLDATTFAYYQKKYAPYGSVASVYLWKYAHEKE